VDFPVQLKRDDDAARLWESNGFLAWSMFNFGVMSDE